MKVIAAPIGKCHRQTHVEYFLRILAQVAEGLDGRGACFPVRR